MYPTTVRCERLVTHTAYTDDGRLIASATIKCHENATAYAVVGNPTEEKYEVAVCEKHYAEADNSEPQHIHLPDLTEYPSAFGAAEERV